MAGRQVVPGAWVARIAAPVTTPLDGWGYSAQWWHRGPDDGEDYSAMGIYGQYTYVHPGRRVVIVKLSDHGAEQDERGTTTCSGRSPGAARRASRLGDAQPGSPSYRWAITSCLRNSKPRCGQVPTYSARACCPAG